MMELAVVVIIARDEDHLNMNSEDSQGARVNEGSQTRDEIC